MTRRDTGKTSLIELVRSLRNLRSNRKADAQEQQAAEQTAQGKQRAFAGLQSRLPQSSFAAPGQPVRSAN